MIKQYKLKSSIDLYYLIAIEKIDLSDLKKSIKDDEAHPAKQDDKDNIAGLKKEFKPKTTESDEFMFIGDSVENLGYELAKCCHPVAGDAVFGFVTIGKGITIHRISCPNARQLLSKFDYRVIDVKWRKTSELKSYYSSIQVTGKDELGILNNITKVISDDAKVNMVSVNVDARSDGIFAGSFKVIVKDTSHLEMLIHKIRKVEGVQKVKRSEVEI